MQCSLVFFPANYVDMNDKINSSVKEFSFFLRERERGLLVSKLLVPSRCCIKAVSAKFISAAIVCKVASENFCNQHETAMVCIQGEE